MRERDSSESRLRRIQASIINGNYDAALAECDLEQRESGPHWRIDMLRGHIYSAERKFNKAREAFGKVRAHSIGCSDPLCLSKAGYVGLLKNASEEGLTVEAFYHANFFLSTVDRTDISVLFLRGSLLHTLWEETSSQNDKLLDTAIRDLREAYALLDGLPDDKFYALKCLREASEVSHELESNCRDIETMSLLMEINPIVSGSTADANPVFGSNITRNANALFGAVQPADTMRVMIGYLLIICCVLAETEECWVEAADVLDEIEPLVREHDDAEMFAQMPGMNLDAEMFAEMFAQMLVISGSVRLAVYCIREEKCYLDAAKSKLAELLMLQEQHPLPDEVRESVVTLNSEIDKLSDDSDT